jgi:hypothetical protein
MLWNEKITIYIHNLNKLCINKLISKAACRRLHVSAYDIPVLTRFQYLDINHGLPIVRACWPYPHTEHNKVSDVYVVHLQQCEAFSYVFEGVEVRPGVRSPG